MCIRKIFSRKTFSRNAFLFIFLNFLFCTNVYGGLKSAVDSIKIINIRSIKQKAFNLNKVLFEGDVEILLDYKMHIWADRVEFDKEKQTIIASADNNGFVKLENPDLLMLAEHIELNLKAKTGSAKNIKIHVKDGFLSSQKAEKIDEQTWRMEKLKYTSCDNARAHWAFTAHSAVLYKNSVLKASGLLFKIMEIPVFAFPGLVFPLQNRAGSGFLIPRLSFDAELGFGFRQEYYYLIDRHCDTTVGFNLVEKKGFILSDEFRWASSPENFLIMNCYYAEEWDAFLERKGQIINATDKHYWINGVYFQPFNIGEFNFQSLVRFDFGTDKRVGYHFLNGQDRVEDSFYNSLITRYHDRRNIMQFMVHSERSLRKQFSKQIESKQKEREEKVTINYFPRYEWSTGYYKILDLKEFPQILYRHDFLFDHPFLESREKEKLYIETCVDKVMTSYPLIDIETTRLLYKGQIQASYKLMDQKFKCFVEPHFHLRSNVKKGTSYKFFNKFCAEWSRYYDYFQPVIRWSYLPKFYQNNWYHIDKYDRFYPENRLEFILRNSFDFDNFDIDVFLNQGYDFYSSPDIFPLRRCYNQNHLLPLKFYLECSSQNLGLSLNQEYGWRNGSLLQSEFMVCFSWDKYDLFLRYLYQKEAVQKDRGLFSDIPTFALAGFSIPLAKHLQFTYEGSFFSRYKRALPILNSLKPMLHKFRLHYDGHCWAISLGWEEKRYRQYGKWKSERSITLALSLDSIGSFAQKFKRPKVEY